MPRYALTLAYDGTHFSGWQKQEPPAPAEGQRVPATIAPELDPGREGRVALRTVQAVVERAVRFVVREPIILLGASRTDSGVHARGQVAAFTCSPREDDPSPDLEATPRGSGWPASRGADTLLRAINGRLPEDVLCTRCTLVANDFDPIGGCSAKGYSYTLHVAPPHAREGSPAGLRPLFDRAFVHHVHDVLEVGAMRRAAAHFVGEHDFAAFAAAGHGRLTTVRRVFSCAVNDAPSDHGARRVRIEISGSGFLWNMVRIIAGTLVDVGRGRIDADAIPAILAGKDRARAGPTLPPTGLCLEWIRYPELPNHTPPEAPGPAPDA